MVANKMNPYTYLSCGICNKIFVWKQSATAQKEINIECDKIKCSQRISQIYKIPARL